MRAIARELGLSKSAVHRVLMAEPEPEPAAQFVDDGDVDPWSDPEIDPGLFDTEEERWPAEPFTFVGYEREWFSRGKGNGGYWGDMERWVDGDGHSIGSEHESCEMALYRYEMHVAHELGDREHARSLGGWCRTGSFTRKRNRPKPAPHRTDAERLSATCRPNHSPGNRDLWWWKIVCHAKHQPPKGRLAAPA